MSNKGLAKFTSSKQKSEEIYSELIGVNTEISAVKLIQEGKGLGTTGR